MATEFIYEVRSDLGFKKPESDFKYIRPNFLSEIITLARESKGPSPSCFCLAIKLAFTLNMVYDGNLITAN